HYNPGAPTGPPPDPPPLPPERFGRVTRHYIRCLEDRAIPLAGQDFMIAALDAAIGGRTRVHSLTASHSPIYSQPKLLADLLAGIAGERAARRVPSPASTSILMVY